MDKKSNITSRDRFMAKVCMNCTVCKHARKKQEGPYFGLSAR